MIGGDFNVWHDYFEPGVSSHGRGGELVHWLTHNSVDYIGESGVPTHDRGHVLDLTFSNIPFSQSLVRPDMHSGSDHETQVTLIPGRGDTQLVQHQFRITEADLPKFVGLVETGVSQLSDPLKLRTSEEIDQYAAALAGVFNIAIETAGRPDRGGGKPAPWWTQECRDAHRDYHLTKSTRGGVDS